MKKIFRFPIDVFAWLAFSATLLFGGAHLSWAGNLVNPPNITYAQGTLPIAHGGTGATSYTAPVGTIYPILFYNGTFQTDTLPTHLGYDGVADTVYTAAINISGASTQTARFTNTQASSPAAGAGMIGISDDGAALANGDRLGFYTLGGSYDAAHSTDNAVAFTGFTTQAWSLGNNGAEARIEVTPNGSTTRSAKVTVTASNGTRIAGTTTNDSANAGDVGEYIESVVTSATPVALTTGVPANVTSITLTPGDWDVSGLVGFVPAATTNYTIIAGGSSNISATQLETSTAAIITNVTGGANPRLTINNERYSVAVNTTIYLVAYSTFTVSTMSSFGVISARRVR